LIDMAVGIDPAPTSSVNSTDQSSKRCIDPGPIISSILSTDQTSKRGVSAAVPLS
jgi:hypothetical protein